MTILLSLFITENCFRRLNTVETRDLFRATLSSWPARSLVHTSQIKENPTWITNNQVFIFCNNQSLLSSHRKQQNLLNMQIVEAIMNNSSQNTIAGTKHKEGEGRVKRTQVLYILISITQILSKQREYQK